MPNKPPEDNFLPDFSNIDPASKLKKAGFSQKAAFIARDLDLGKLHNIIVNLTEVYDFFEGFFKSKIISFRSIENLTTVLITLDSFIEAVEGHLGGAMFMELYKDGVIKELPQEETQLKEVTQEDMEHVQRELSMRHLIDKNKTTDGYKILKRSTTAASMYAQKLRELRELIVNSPDNGENVFTRSVNDYFTRKCNIWANGGKKTEDAQTLVKELTLFCAAFPNFSNMGFVTHYMPSNNTEEKRPQESQEEYKIVFNDQNISYSQLFNLSALDPKIKQILKRPLAQAKDFVGFIVNNQSDFKSQQSLYDYIDNITKNNTWLLKDERTPSTPEYFGIKIKDQGLLRIYLSYNEGVKITIKFIAEG
jgi:hypothetical protein